jgi:hypothetical protein
MTRRNNRGHVTGKTLAHKGCCHLPFFGPARIFLAHVYLGNSFIIPVKNQNLSGLDIPTQESVQTLGATPSGGSAWPRSCTLFSTVPSSFLTFWKPLSVS